MLAIFRCVVGATIHACWALGCHIVALEEDKSVFEALVAPLNKPSPTIEPKAKCPAILPIDLDDEEIIVRRGPRHLNLVIKFILDLLEYQNAKVSFFVVLTFLKH